MVDHLRRRKVQVVVLVVESQLLAERLSSEQHDGFDWWGIGQSNEKVA